MPEKTISINKLNKQSFRLRLIGFVLISLSIISLLIITTNQVNQIKNNRHELSLIAHQIDSLTILRDDFRLKYLKAKGYDFSRKKTLLSESIKADSLLTQLQLRSSVSRDIVIEYYRKSLDQEKVRISLKELGYKNILDLPSSNPKLMNDETNTIALSTNIPLLDVKLIALTLIQAGFRVQHVYFFQSKNRKNLIQIIRTAPSNGSPDKSPSLSVDRIGNAKSINDLFH